MKSNNRSERNGEQTMIILLLIIVFVLGMGTGGYIVYKYEEKTIVDMNKRCSEASERLNTMIKDEERFLETIHPKLNEYIPMQGNLVDYLKAKYLHEEFEPDCEDESDNLYV
jgi:exopolysaccharide biosynthesis protein